MLFLIQNLIKNKKAKVLFVIDLSRSVQFYFIHRLALMIWREKLERTEGKTVCTYAGAHVYSVAFIITPVDFFRVKRETKRHQSYPLCFKRTPTNFILVSFKCIN